uniref:NHL repeat-containing protein 3 n=1 Tax=Leptobrachium leishanense TaxID=445787 RepID=A0A8C5LSZ1_9ANUR
MKRSFWSRMQGKPGLGLCALAAVITLLLVHSCKPQSLQKEHESYYSAQQEESMQLYKLDANWPKNPDLFTGVPYGVAVDPQNSLVYVAQRGDNVSKVLVFTEEGYFKGKWDTDTLEMPHGIFFVSTNKENSIWVTDVGNGINGHSIKKYSPSGNLISVLGTPGEAGTSLTPLQFDQPAEIFVEKNGDLYIADGDGGLNNRVLKLTDQFWLEWTLGGNGTNPGQFYIPHSVAVDDVGRVWVADRGNKRIQVFDKTSGEPLGLWSTCFTDDGPYSVRFTADKKYMVVAQLNINRVLLISVPPIGDIGACNVVSTIQMADKVRPHLVDVSIKTGSIYVAELGAEQVQKYVIRRNL